MNYDEKIVDDTMDYFDSVVAYICTDHLEEFRAYIEGFSKKKNEIKAIKSICLGMANSKHNRALKINLDKLSESEIDTLEFEKRIASIYLDVAMQYHSLL